MLSCKPIGCMKWVGFKTGHAPHPFTYIYNHDLKPSNTSKEDTDDGNQIACVCMAVSGGYVERIQRCALNECTCL